MKFDKNVVNGIRSMKVEIYKCCVFKFNGTKRVITQNKRFF